MGVNFALLAGLLAALGASLACGWKLGGMAQKNEKTPAGTARNWTFFFGAFWLSVGCFCPFLCFILLLLCVVVFAFVCCWCFCIEVFVLLVVVCVVFVCCCFVRSEPIANA
jgi:hypothetical protein